MSTISGVQGPGQAPIGKRVATAFVALAVACSLISFAGWVFDVPALRTFGIAGRPIWPLAALGYAALSTGFLALALGMPRIARAALAVPLLIAGYAIVEVLVGDLGFARLWFDAILATHGGAQPGRPSTNSIAIFLLLGIAGLRAADRRPGWDPLVGALGTGALALGIAATLLIFSGSPADPELRRFSSSLPAGIMAISLASACIAWNSDFARLGLLSARRADRQVVQFLLPVAVIVLSLPSLVELWFVRSGVTPLVSELIVVLVNVAMISGLIYWTATRLAGEHAARTELTEALESTTVALAAPDGSITHWSRGCEQLYGWTAEEARGRNKYALLRSRDLHDGSSCARLPIEEGARELYEMHRDGTEITVLERVHRVASPGRGPVLVLSMTDVSQATEAMAALKESQERLATATATHQLGVFEWDVASGRIEWSPGTEQRLGLVPGTITDFESWTAQVEPGDVEAILETVARTVAERAESFNFRFRFLRPNGAIRAVEGSSRAFYDGNGNLLRAVGAMLDITERDEREAALRGREAQLRSVLETVPDAMVVIDEAGEIRQFSAAAERMWGYRTDAVLGRSFTMLAPADERDRYGAALRHFLKPRQRNWFGDVIAAAGETADGRRFPVEVRAGIARVEGKRLITIFFRDLTERLATEERLSELSDELAHVSRQSAMTELAADLAHELNQPLTASANFLAAARMLIDKGEDIERIADLLRMGAEQTQRAGQIIRRMRDFTARGEVGMRPESVNRIVREAVELVLVGTGQFDIRVIYSLDTDAEIVHADRIQVQQVLVNLLRNSMHALRSSRRNERQITIGSRKIDEALVEIQVSDSGPGIPEAILANLFTRFTTTKRGSGGMGIGLSISRRIIEAHGGTLSAENRPLGGATFRFTLPAVEGGE